MAKYIVEAPEPKKGQKVSSGGIRERGKLAAQFKNPVPYKSPTPNAIVARRPSNTAIARKEQSRARLIEAGKYLFGIAWQELGEPVFRSGLHKLGDTIVSRIEALTAQYIPPTEYEVIDVEAETIEDTDEDDNIIRFPGHKTI